MIRPSGTPSFEVVQPHLDGGDDDEDRRDHHVPDGVGCGRTSPGSIGSCGSATAGGADLPSRARAGLLVGRCPHRARSRSGGGGVGASSAMTIGLFSSYLGMR